MRAWFGVGFGLMLVLALAGCRSQQRGQPQENDTASEGGEEVAAGPPTGWPRVLVIAPSRGEPALYLGPEQNAAAVGYLNAGVRVRLEAGPSHDRVQVLVGGALPTKAWVPVSRVGLFVQQRGRVEGTRTYVGPGDMVSVLGPAADGQMRVEVRPWMGGTDFLEPAVGTFATAQLADHAPTGETEALTAGECFRLPAGQTVPVYDRAGGQAVAQLPALNPPATVVVLRQSNGWFGIRAGYGPYLTGYVQGALTPCEGARPDPTPAIPHGSGEVPYWMAQENGALHRVASGTRVRFSGRTIARLRQEGWARELGRHSGNYVDVFVAVNDTVAIRGLVEASSLTLVEGAASAPSTPAQPAQPAQPQEPQEPLPDELE